MIDLEKFPSNNIAQEMMQGVTKGWYDHSYVGKWMFQVMGMSMERIKSLYEELPEQFFVETATWGLSFHEEKHGLPIRTEMDIEERRALIYQRTKSRVAITPYNLEQMLKQRLKLQAEISDVHDAGSLKFKPSHPNEFKVTIWEHGTNSEINYEAVEKLILDVKQSHTVFQTEHRQRFEYNAYVYVGLVPTEWVGYEIKSRQVSRDMDKAGCIKAAVLCDTMIFEEIMRKEP